ncbi:unnamed protein product [Bubo scandiacus]
MMRAGWRREPEVRSVRRRLPVTASSGKKKVSKAEQLRLQKEEESRLKEKEAARIEKERIEQEQMEKLEAKDQECRESELAELHSLEQKFLSAQQWKRDYRAHAKWEQYLSCDGSPDPTVRQEINTSLQFLLLHTPPNEITEKETIQYQESILELQNLLQQKYNGATENLLKVPLMQEETNEKEEAITDKNIVDLQLLVLVGGVYHIDALQLPPQVKQIKDWSMVEVSEEKDYTPCSSLVAEVRAYQQMALVASAFAWSEWNREAGQERVVFKVSEHLKSDSAKDKDCLSDFASKEAVDEVERASFLFIDVVYQLLLATRALTHS